MSSHTAFKNERTLNRRQESSPKLSRQNVVPNSKKFIAFDWIEGSLLCQQRTVTCPYPEPHDSNPHSPTVTWSYDLRLHFLWRGVTRTQQLRPASKHGHFITIWNTGRRASQPAEGVADSPRKAWDSSGRVRAQVVAYSWLTVKGGNRTCTGCFKSRKLLPFVKSHVLSLG